MLESRPLENVLDSSLVLSGVEYFIYLVPLLAVKNHHCGWLNSIFFYWVLPRNCSSNTWNTRYSFIFLGSCSWYVFVPISTEPGRVWVFCCFGFLMIIDPVCTMHQASPFVWSESAWPVAMTGWHHLLACLEHEASRFRWYRECPLVLQLLSFCMILIMSDRD